MVRWFTVLAVVMLAAAPPSLAKPLDPAKLVPCAIVDVTASPHRTNKQKVLIERIKVLDAD